MQQHTVQQIAKGRKLASLKRALETFNTASDAHFAALNEWRNAAQ
jgi:hypothetical protein